MDADQNIKLAVTNDYVWHEYKSSFTLCKNQNNKTNTIKMNSSKFFLILACQTCPALYFHINPCLNNKADLPLLAKPIYLLKCSKILFDTSLPLHNICPTQDIQVKKWRTEAHKMMQSV